MRLILDLYDNGDLPKGVITYDGEKAGHAFSGWLELASLIEQAHDKGVPATPRGNVRSPGVGQ